MDNWRVEQKVEINGVEWKVASTTLDKVKRDRVVTLKRKGRGVTGTVYLNLFQSIKEGV
jgi:hypothetical protein